MRAAGSTLVRRTRDEDGGRGYRDFAAGGGGVSELLSHHVGDRRGGFGGDAAGDLPAGARGRRDRGRVCAGDERAAAGGVRDAVRAGGGERLRGGGDGLLGLDADAADPAGAGERDRRGAAHLQLGNQLRRGDQVGGAAGPPAPAYGGDAAGVQPGAAREAGAGDGGAGGGHHGHGHRRRVRRLRARRRGAGGGGPAGRAGGGAGARRSGAAGDPRGAGRAVRGGDGGARRAGGAAADTRGDDDAGQERVPGGPPALGGDSRDGYVAARLPGDGGRRRSARRGGEPDAAPDVDHGAAGEDGHPRRQRRGGPEQELPGGAPAAGRRQADAGAAVGGRRGGRGGLRARLATTASRRTWRRSGTRGWRSGRRR